MPLACAMPPLPCIIALFIWARLSVHPSRTPPPPHVFPRPQNTDHYAIPLVGFTALLLSKRIAWKFLRPVRAAALLHSGAPEVTDRLLPLPRPCRDVCARTEG